MPLQPEDQQARRVVETITRDAAPVILAGVKWHDTRPMLDPRERSGQSIDMATEALDYATAAGLARRHDEQPHLVFIAPLP